MQNKDKVTFMKPEEIISELRSIQNELISTANIFREGIKKTNESFAIYSILKAVSKELHKVIVSELDNEKIAWSTRNLFEINIILRNLLEQNLLPKWISYRISDEVDMLQGLKKYSSLENEQTQVLVNRIEELREYADRNNIQLVGQTNTRELAKKVGLDDEYVAFFKFYSKYVHPTSWSLNVDDETKNSMEYKNILLFNFQKYLQDSKTRIEEYCKNNKPI